MAVMRTDTVPPIYYYGDPSPGSPAQPSSPSVQPVQFSIAQPNQVFRIASSHATMNATLVKASMGGVASLTGYNTSSQARFLKLYNTTVRPVVGTDTPFWMYYMPPQSDFAADFGGSPLIFSQGIGMAFTAGAADNDVGPVADGDIMSFSLTYY